MIQKLKKAYDIKITLILLAILLIILMPFIHFYNDTPTVKFPYVPTTLETYVPHLDVLEKHSVKSKWIVITSVNHMTPSIQQMTTFEDYDVVVVMDVASPIVQHAEENIVYLTLEQQHNLNFYLHDHIPLNSYTRKNIGYLYAIQNGARIIYDTDDDNFVELAPRKRNVRMDELASCTGGDHLALNPYAAFGKPAIWPRGFPLENIALECTGRGSRRTNNSLPLSNASIWQGLADLDPDVDAVFRMTHTDQLKRVIFPRRPPVFIPHHKFAPFNSQNTIFSYESFWALYLPSSVSFRVTDIWRGYFTQKLLRYTGSYLAFIGPTVEQNRNAHHFASDFESEGQMYDQTTDLLVFLHDWEPMKSTRFFDIMIELAQSMADADFWKETDVRAIRAWVKDLRRMGYEEPRVVNHIRNNEQQRHNDPFQLCAAPFNGKKIARDMDRWWKMVEKKAPATFAVQMDTRGFGAYLYDILFSSSYMIQANRSIAYNRNDHSAYDSSFCENQKGLLCFFDAPASDYPETALGKCAQNNITEPDFCSVLSSEKKWRGAIASETFVQNGAAEIVPRVLHDQGWGAMHWFGFLTQKLTRPTKNMSAEIDYVKKEMGWSDKDEQCVAVHIRRSDKKAEYTAHAYPSAVLYADEVRRLKIEHPDITSVFLTSDSQQAIDEFARACHYYLPTVRIMTNAQQKRFNGKECGPIENACPNRNGITDEDEKRAWAVNSMVDFYLLSSCPYLVGSFSSFFTKAAAYRMVGTPEILQEMNAEDRFRSIDDDDALQTWKPQHTVLFDLSIN